MLTEHDLSSEVWLKIEKHLNTRLEQRRRDNDSDSLDEIKTARLRGRIAEIKDLLAFGKPKPEQEEED